MKRDSLYISTQEAEMRMFFVLMIRFLSALAGAKWKRTSHTWWRPLEFVVTFTGYLLICLAVVLLSPRRAALALLIYTWFRPIDDILDDEDSKSSSNLELIVKNKTETMAMFANDGLNELTDPVLFAVAQLSDKIGIKDELRARLPIIWGNMLKEHTWKNLHTVPTRAELHNLASSTDDAIAGTLLLIFGLPIAVFKKIDFYKSGVFSRVDWIEDLEKDLSVGIVRVPAEECRSKGIICDPLSILKSRSSLHEIVREELKFLHELWKQVELQNELVLEALPLSSRLVYRRVMRMTERSLAQLSHQYNVV